MKIGIQFSNTGPLGTPEGAAALAEGAEKYGIESLWTVEHVVVPTGYESPYPYSPTGKMPGGETMPLPDPLIFLSWVAARTTEVKLATGILILPQRNPVILAKEIATLDLMSGGRMILGIGVGWLKEEFEAIGVPFEGRGKRADEYIDALRSLWTEAESSYEGDLISFKGLNSYPKPVNGTVPIVVGGHTEVAARRAGRRGDGFFPGRGDTSLDLIEVMRAEAEKQGRDPDSIEVTVGGKPTPEFFAQMEEINVSRVLLMPPGFMPDQIDPGFDRLMNQIAGS